MLPWVYGSSGPAPEALRCEDDDGVLNTAADHDAMSSASGADCHHQQVCLMRLTQGAGVLGEDGIEGAQPPSQRSAPTLG